MKWKLELFLGVFTQIYAQSCACDEWIVNAKDILLSDFLGLENDSFCSQNESKKPEITPPILSTAQLESHFFADFFGFFREYNIIVVNPKLTHGKYQLLSSRNK